MVTSCKHEARFFFFLKEWSKKHAVFKFWTVKNQKNSSSDFFPYFYGTDLGFGSHLNWPILYYQKKKKKKLTYFSPI